MEQELSANANVDVTLIKGARGAFEVKLGEELIYSKHATKRFPEEGEITALLSKRGAG